MPGKPRFQLRAIGIPLLSLLLLLLSACGPSGTPATTSTPSSQPVQGGTWIDDMPATPTSLIPEGAGTVYANVLQQCLYAPLLMGDTQGKIHAGLLTDVPSLTNGGISADFKTFVFHMRPNLKWSDGQPENADDIDYTWKLINNPDYGAQLTSGFDHIKSADVSADKLTITFHLTSAYSPFIPVWVDALSSPLPQHHFGSMKPGDILKSPENLNPKVVSGPFQMSDSNPGHQFTMVPNPNYYRANENGQKLPHISKLVWNVGVAADTILKDVQAGSITSSWFLDPTKLPTYQKIQGYNLVNPAAGGFEGLFFNLKQPALKDVNVRKAIVMAIDRKALHDRIKPGIGNVLCLDVPNTFTVGYEADAPCPTFDVAAANKLLDDNGWVKGTDGTRAKGGVKLEVPLSTSSNYAWRVNSVLFIQQQLQAIGVKANIINYPSSTFFSQILPQGDPAKYGISEFGFDLGYDPDDSSLLSCSQIPSQANNFGGSNYSFYCNKNLDPLLDKQLAIADPTQREALFKQIHQILLTDLPYIGLFDSAHPAIVKKGTHNYVPGPMGGEEAIQVYDWWCDGGKC